MLQVFTEYFTQIQLSNLEPGAMEAMTNSKAEFSLAAAQLMGTVMKQQGRDMSGTMARALPCKSGALGSLLAPVPTS